MKERNYKVKAVISTVEQVDVIIIKYFIFMQGNFIA